MKVILILFNILIALDVSAQIPQPAMLSLKGYGGSGKERIFSNVATTNDGGFIIGIETTSPIGTGNIDSFCKVGSGSIFLKYNADATVLEWTKCYSVSGDSTIKYLFPQVDGTNVLIGSYTYLLEGIFITKHNSNDVPVWEKSYSRDSSAFRIEDAIQTKDGGFVILGSTLYTDMNFPVHYGSWMTQDIAIIKFDSAGNKQWSKVYGGSGEEMPVKILEAANHDFYIVASSQSNDFDFPGFKGGGLDVLLLKIDSIGNKLWHRHLGGSKGDAAHYACLNGKDGLLIAASTSSSDGDVHYHIGNAANFWVVELDSSGSRLWDNCYGSGVSGDSPKSICKATDGSIWVAGSSQQQGGHVYTSYGRGDAFFIHADSVGNFLSAKVLGSTGFPSEESWLVHPLPNSNVLAGGHYSTNDGAFTSLPNYNTASSGLDAFLVIFSPWTTSTDETTAVQDVFRLYPNPVHDILYVEVEKSNNYTLTIQDNQGKQVYQYSGKGNLKIDTKSWVKGIYHATYNMPTKEKVTLSFIVD